MANVFTEDHAALTGAKRCNVRELRPETSWNANLNFCTKFQSKKNYSVFR